MIADGSDSDQPHCPEVLRHYTQLDRALPVKEIMQDEQSLSQSELIVAHGVATLCCGGKKCPTLRVEDGMVHISDDFGGHVRMSAEQALLITRAIKAVSDHD